MWELCQRSFSSVFSFCKWKVTTNGNVSFTDYASRIRLLDYSKLAIYWRNNNDVTISRHDVTVKLFWCFVSLVKFSYWSKLHVYIITSFGVMAISFYKGLARNPEIPPFEFCPITWDRGELRIPHLTQMFIMKCYWMLHDAKVTALTVSELLRENKQRARRGRR